MAPDDGSESRTSNPWGRVPRLRAMWKWTYPCLRNGSGKTVDCFHRCIGLSAVEFDPRQFERFLLLDASTTRTPGKYF
jgi:hypothetical protein